MSVPPDRFVTPLAFIFLREHSAFLAFDETTVQVWDFRGNMLRSFDDHSLCIPFHGMDHAACVCITDDQDAIISICVRTGAMEGDARAPGPPAHRRRSKRHLGVHVSCIGTGRCLARLSPAVVDAHGRPPLQNLSALSFEEGRGDIVTGTEQGFLHVWSN